MNLNDVMAWDSEALNDGWHHVRNDFGTCLNCGAASNEPHYKLKRREMHADENEKSEGPEAAPAKKVPTEDIRKVHAYLGGYLSGLQHAMDHIDEAENQITFEMIRAEEAALHNVEWFLIEEFGEFE